MLSGFSRPFHASLPLQMDTWYAESADEGLAAISRKVARSHCNLKCRCLQIILLRHQTELHALGFLSVFCSFFASVGQALCGKIIFQASCYALIPQEARPGIIRGVLRLSTLQQGCFSWRTAQGPVSCQSRIHWGSSTAPDSAASLLPLTWPTAVALPTILVCSVLRRTV